MISEIFMKGAEVLDKYTDFASVYDILMSHIPYDEWADYIEYIKTVWNRKRLGAGA